jgi:hypothetical protein
VEIYSAPAFRDDTSWQPTRQATLRPPVFVSGYSYIMRIDDPELSATPRHTCGTTEARADDEALALYNTLWTLEFKTVPLPPRSPFGLASVRRREVARAGLVCVLS